MWKWWNNLGKWKADPGAIREVEIVMVNKLIIFLKDGDKITNTYSPWTRGMKDIVGPWKPFYKWFFGTDKPFFIIKYANGQTMIRREDIQSFRVRVENSYAS